MKTEVTVTLPTLSVAKNAFATLPRTNEIRALPHSVSGERQAGGIMQHYVWVGF